MSKRKKLVDQPSTVSDVYTNAVVGIIADHIGKRCRAERAHLLEGTDAHMHARAVVSRWSPQSIRAFYILSTEQKQHPKRSLAKRVGTTYETLCSFWSTTLANAKIDVYHEGSGEPVEMKLFRRANGNDGGERFYAKPIIDSTTGERTTGGCVLRLNLGKLDSGLVINIRDSTIEDYRTVRGNVEGAGVILENDASLSEERRAELRDQMNEPKRERPVVRGPQIGLFSAKTGTNDS